MLLAVNALILECDLSEGVLENNIVTCQNHKARFDVTTGKVVSPPLEPLDLPDIEDVPKYLAKIFNQDISVKLSPTV
jgi:nitrite reductase/ring-hydroxylating ferredoxin subunit